MRADYNPIRFCLSTDFRQSANLICMSGPARHQEVVEDENLEDEVEGVHEEEYKIIMDPNKLYNDDHIENELVDSSISQRFAEFHETYGVDSYKLYNFRMLDDDTLIYAAGISYKIHNVKTGKVKLFFSRDGGGIGSIAVDRQQKYYAVAEKGVSPNIYIFEYPSLRLHRILRQGTDRSYSNVSFSLRGEKLASVGSEPDYNICIWDWRNEILVLKAKAFSQEVFRVMFSDHSDTILSTSGLAHLRFWKIANTFTGLKLKGQTGKFGAVELSDITGFYIFQDGKVCSGSDHGRLLLWEGNLIKVVLCLSEEKGCHEGVINTVQRVGDCIVSAGKDGMIKYWSYDSIDGMEANDQLLGFLTPVREFMIATNPEDPPEKHTPADILEILVYKNYWLVHDALGKVFKVEVGEDTITQQQLYSFNSGRIMGICNTREGNALASIGQDGAIRLLDYVNRKEHYSRGFGGKGTCIDWLRMTSSHKDRFVAAGYDNGIVRVVHFSKDKIVLQKAMKVHNNPVKSLAFSPSGDALAVLSSLGEIFFLSVYPDQEKPGEIRIDPICIQPLQKKIRTMVWGQKINTLLLACETGEVIELEVPRAYRPEDEDLREEDRGFDSTQTYLNEVIRSRSFTIKMMEFQRPKFERDVNALLEDKPLEVIVEWDPAPISAATYLDESNGEFICAVEGQYLGYYYICRFGEERPLQAVESSLSVTKYISVTGEGQFIVSGTEKGEIFVRLTNNMDYFSKLPNHDQNTGRVVGVVMNADMTALTSASEDATILTKAIDLKYFKEVAALRQSQKIERENRKNRKLNQEDEEEVEGENPEDEESDDERAYKTDSFDIAIANMPLNIPKLEGGIQDQFFFDDKEGRADHQDILDANIYSIQEEKLLAEEDKRRSEAEKRKQQMRDEIQLLREKFQTVKKNDEALDDFVRLSFEDFNIDPEYYKMLQDRITDMLDEANKEVNWSIEYNKLKTTKLKDFFISELEFDRMSVKAFKKPISVTTMRIKKPSQYTLGQWNDKEISKIGEEKKEELLKIEEKGKETGQQKAENLIDNWIAQNKELKIDQSFLKTKKDDLKRQQSVSSKEKFTRAKMKVDKDLRSQMKKELTERRPDPKSNNESEEVKEAQANMGNYKLKSDPGYEVPTQDRMSMKKQRRLIFLLEEFLYGSKKDFNENLQQMRDTKRVLFNKIIESNKRLAQINQELQITETLFVPEYDNNIEFPERHFEVTKEEVEELAKQKEEERLRKKQGRFGAEKGEEAAGAGEEEGEDGKGEVRRPRVEIQFVKRSKMRTQNSEKEKSLKEIRQLRLRNEKKLISDEVNGEIIQFDDELEKLAGKKIRLEFEVKYIQMRLVTSYQELIILDAFEKKDEILLAEHEKLKAKDKENSENKFRNAMLIQEKKDSQKKFEGRCKDAEARFNEKVVNKENANIAYNIYKASQKRNKTIHTDDGGDDMDGVMDEEDDAAHKDLNPEVKSLLKEWQSDLPNAGFVRERYDTERLKDECATAIAQLKSAEAGFEEEKQKGVNALNATRAKIKALQKEKLEKISTLYVTYFLRLDQIKNLFESYSFIKIAPRLERSILFTNTDLEKLHTSLKKLGANTSMIEQECKALQTRQKALDREKAILDKAYKEALAECDEIYQLKFGNRIPQEVLDGLEPSPKLKNLQKEFEKEEKLSIRKNEEANELLKITKKELLEIKQKNTQIINFITEKGNEQLKLNKNLDSTNNNITKEEKDNKKNDLMTFRKNLIEIIKLLNQQIEGVRYEISIFKQKGGKIANVVVEENRMNNEDFHAELLD